MIKHQSMFMMSMMTTPRYHAHGFAQVVDLHIANVMRLLEYRDTGN